jgi:hypothetical protein
MSNELQKSLAERAKEFLQLEGEHSFFELAEFLREARNATHPDKFQSQDLKEKAEARFKSAQALLDEFERQMELDRFNLKPSELAIYKPFYDAVQLQSELDKTKKELEDTKYELKSEREVNSDLNKQLATKQDESLRAEIQHLQSIYKPSTRKYASIGLAIVLSGALAVMTQMEKVSGILEKYSPFGKQYISLGLFVCLVFFLVAMLRKMWEREYIKRKSEEVCSPKYADEFMAYLKPRRSSDAAILEFSEVEVFDFISGRNYWFKKVSRLVGFQIFRPETVNGLKDILIHNLLSKKLVSVSKAEMMQRYFTISSTRTDMFWYREYVKEREKNQKAPSVDDDD